MKHLIIVPLLACCIIFVHAQQNDLHAVDRRVLNMPESEGNSTDSIAAFIQANFFTEKEKFRAIYRWVTYNIQYDRDSMYSLNWGGDPARKVTAALRRKKGVCENYAAIFHEIALKCNLQSFIVSGYTKQLGITGKAGHCWCAARVNENWFLCDPTWDENYLSEPVYFLVSPSIFIDTHLPFDPLWQLLDDPVSPRDFQKGNFITHSGRAKYGVVDSIKAFMQLSELKQLESSVARIKNAGVENELTRTQLAFMEMNASLIYEDRDMKQYNAAVAALNKAAVLLNDFIDYRNNMFMPLTPDSLMSKLLPPLDVILLSAEKNLNELDQSVTNAQYDTQGVKYKVVKFRARLKQQEDFLKLYLSTTVAERKKLFYNAP